MKRIKEELKKLKVLFRNKYFLAAFLTILIIGGFLIYLVATQNKEVAETTTTTKKTTTTTKDMRVTSKLAGIKIDSSQVNKKIVGVVVENHPDARPQSGLDQASVVYETLAEGGITRFLALFQENEVPEIGPVRSARAYFLDWVSEYDATFGHVGGNIDALDLIGPMGIQDINQFYLANYFWRDNSRYAPHNVYTTTEKQRQAAAQMNYSASSNFSGLTFKKDTELAARPQTANFTVHFSAYNFDPTYTYDRTTNTWARSLAGVPFVAKSGAQIKPKNVIVEYTDFSYGVTRAGEQATRITTIGSGLASFFIDGERIDGTWSKASAGSKTIFKDSAGKEISLNSGQTWIEVIPNGNSVEYSKT